MSHESLQREAEALAIVLRALRWYADRENYADDDWGVRSVVTTPDYGNPGGKARRALARAERLLHGREA
jgi:hypothetical protein